MIERRENMIESFREIFRRHTLEEITAPESRVRAFYLRAPGTRMGSVLLTFSPEGITITGDNPPTGHGTVSRRALSLEWFADEKSADYLCSKFLVLGYDPGTMIESLRDLAHDVAEDGSRDRAARIGAIANRIESDPDTPKDRVYEDMIEAGIDAPWEMGRNYEPAAAAKLIVIHERFRELFPHPSGEIPL